MPLRPLLSLFLFPLLLFGQAPTEKSLLWKIKSRTLPADSYLYGTIHLIAEQDFFMLPSLEKAMGEVKGLAMEIDVSAMEDVSQLLPLMMQGFMKADTTLSMLFNPEDYRIVSQHFQDMGLPMALLEKLKPMLLSSLDPAGLGIGEGGPLKSYEMALLAKARLRNLEVRGLETMAFQMSLFDSIPYAIQARMLLEQIQRKREGEGMLREMSKVYRQQDIQEMERMLEADAGMDQFKDLLLYRRNRKWVAPVIDLMRRQPTLIAVGAGHLPGDKGLISLLRQAGFDVEPLY